MASVLIAISGKKRHGKDTIADVLVEELDFTRVSFATQLKAAVYALDPAIPYPGSRPRRAWTWLRRRGRPLRVAQVVDELGWERAKDTYPEVRRLLQRMGTEVGRDLFGESFWVAQALAVAAQVPGPVVISDARFINEANAVKAAGGVLVRVNRPSVVSTDTHPSETELDAFGGFDHVVVNDGTLEALRDEARAIGASTIAAAGPTTG